MHRTTPTPTATATATRPARRRGPRRAVAALALAAVAVVATGCGSDSGGSSDEAVSSEPAGCRTAEAATSNQTAPDPTVPAEGVTAIEKTDDIEGCGAEAQADSTVKVHYVLKSQATGQVVDSSWDRGQPFDVTLGQGQVIKGWDEGIPGMKAGGRRTLVLGPDYGYGAAGSPPDIAPGDTLVFVVDLLSVS